MLDLFQSISYRKPVLSELPLCKECFVQKIEEVHSKEPSTQIELAMEINYRRHPEDDEEYLAERQRKQERKQKQEEKDFNKLRRGIELAIAKVDPMIELLKSIDKSACRFLSHLQEKGSNQHRTISNKGRNEN